MREALNRTPMYKQALQRLKVSWIGLRLIPPLLLGILEGRKEEQERKQWEEIEKDAGFIHKRKRLQQRHGMSGKPPKQ